MQDHPTLQEIMADILSRPVVPLWPHAGMALGLSRGTTYAAAGRNEIDTIRVGRLIRATTAPLRKKLDIAPPPA